MALLRALVLYCGIAGVFTGPLTENVDLRTSVSEVLLYTGEKASFSCFCTGCDEIIWSHSSANSDSNFLVIEELSEVDIEQQREKYWILTNGNQTVNFNVKNSDGGVFTCSGKNFASGHKMEGTIRLVVNDCLPQKPTVITDPGSSDPLVNCTNDGNVATLSCYVDFHCEESLAINLRWTAFFVQTDNGEFQGYPLMAEPRYRSKVSRLPGQGYILKAQLVISNVSTADYNRKFKCAVGTRFDYSSIGERPPKIEGRLCNYTGELEGDYPSIYSSGSLKRHGGASNSSGKMTFNNNLIPMLISLTLLSNASYT